MRVYPANRPLGRVRSTDPAIEFFVRHRKRSHRCEVLRDAATPTAARSA